MNSCKEFFLGLLFLAILKTKLEKKKKKRKSILQRFRSAKNSFLTSRILLQKCRDKAVARIRMRLSGELVVLQEGQLRMEASDVAPNSCSTRVIVVKESKSKLKATKVREMRAAGEYTPNIARLLFILNLNFSPSEKLVYDRHVPVFSWYAAIAPAIATAACTPIK